MIPTDLGLPDKFRTWRPGQEEAIIAAATSDKQFFLLNNPTGGGKSAIAMGIANLLDTRALVLTSTKGLMTQYENEYRAMGLRQIKGQNNYRCEIEKPDFVTVDQGVCHSGVACMLRAFGCTYFDAVRTAAQSKLVVTNYRYWMTINRFSDPEQLGRFGLLILDEAHDAPDELADFCTVTIEQSEVHPLLDMDLPPIEEGVDIWADWAKSALRELKPRYQAAKNRLHEGTKYIRLVRRYARLEMDLDQLALAGGWRRGDPGDPNVILPGQATDWVAEYKYDRVSKKPVAAVFSPTWAHAYANGILFKSIPRIVLMSATLQPTTARYLGIEEGKFEFLEMASSFEPKRRPVYYSPTTKVDRSMGDGERRIWINKIDRIIDPRLDRKGIISTVSYDRANDILANSKNRRIMFPRPSDLNQWGKPKDTAAMVAAFKAAPAPAVLVSPAMETGWDFPYDQCEYMILAKVPFLDTRGAVIQARAKSDKQYLNYMSALRIIQTGGRGMRAADDMCETFIIDDNIAWFIGAARAFFPKWFMRAWRRLELGELPPPPPRVWDAPKPIIAPIGFVTRSPK